jgi:hypothetical protein
MFFCLISGVIKEHASPELHYLRPEIGVLVEKEFGRFNPGFRNWLRRNPKKVQFGVIALWGLFAYFAFKIKSI